MIEGFYDGLYAPRQKQACLTRHAAFQLTWASSWAAAEPEPSAEPPLLDDMISWNDLSAARDTCGRGGIHINLHRPKAFKGQYHYFSMAKSYNIYENINKCIQFITFRTFNDKDSESLRYRSTVASEGHSCATFAGKVILTSLFSLSAAFCMNSSSSAQARW